MSKSKTQSTEQFNLVIVGAGSAGKTAITHKFLYDSFLEAYEPTTADQYRKKQVIDSIEAQLDILDTAGQESMMRDSYYKQADGFLVVYSVAMQATFSAAKIFHQEIVNSCVNIPIVLVANKIDLEKKQRINPS
eukprot:TRINITY_DN86_c2_g1_i3.p1 TRINITY_DN86_c2_g1~~TRINITY_DN86_c2_g1_i3.p1  ORF type:complete len:134 (-),score=25.35 TRINITY_DN86_c2_g1_i3:667-1068(-)